MSLKEFCVFFHEIFVGALSEQERFRPAPNRHAYTLCFVAAKNEGRKESDDEPLLPPIWLTTPHPPGDTRLWRVALPVVRTAERGAYKPVPPVQEESDLEKLHYPPYEEVPSLKSKMLEEAVELTGGLLPIKFHSDELHYGPIEWAVRLRGMDNLLYDVIDRPQFVHRLMDFITEGMVRYHRAREAA